MYTLKCMKLGPNGHLYLNALSISCFLFPKTSLSYIRRSWLMTSSITPVQRLNVFLNSHPRPPPIIPFFLILSSSFLSSHPFLHLLLILSSSFLSSHPVLHLLLILSFSYADLMRRQEELRRLEELRNQELQKRKQIEMRCVCVSRPGVSNPVLVGFSLQHKSTTPNSNN